MIRIRPCGMSWSYCDGRCEKCEKCQTTATANTPIVNTPTYYYCDRNLCATMEINGKECEDCPAYGGEVTDGE